MEMNIDDMSTDTIKKYLQTREKKEQRNNNPFKVGDVLLHFDKDLHHTFKERVCVCTKVFNDGQISHEHLFKCSINTSNHYSEFEKFDIYATATLCRNVDDNDGSDRRFKH